MTSKLSQDLQIFVDFCQKHIKGDEKSEAQTFLDRFFRAFGHEGAMEAGAVYEQRVKKGSKTGKTGFADLVWKPRVLIEMKKRGTDLNKHYSQAFDYWIRLVPDRPRYVLLCNFDEFWVYDFEIQLDTPIDVIPLLQLPQQLNAFGFMEWSNRTPIFRNNQVEVTERAARRMGELLYELETRGIDKLIAQRFILQCVLAMFSEDRGLLPSGMFIECVKACLQGESSYDVLNALFQEMNRKGKTPAGRYKDVDYFNGGLFAEIHPIELTEQELKMLEVSALEDWSKIRPAIFGNLFESAIDEKERHAHGIHFTSEVDIMKIVRPTISRYWEEKIEDSKTISELENLQLELQSYRVLDPACGSGNFLYIAYQELKRIEQLLLDCIADRRKSPREQIQMGFITPMQFYGIDNNPFAVELARVTMMIARKVAIDKFGLSEPALPLDSLDQNIVCEDALFVKWPDANAVVGNPPFLGGSRIRNELGDNYTNKVFQKFSNIHAQVDFSSYWFRVSHDHINENGRVGLVATNSISQGKSRSVSLDYIVNNGGYIHEAISSQTWSGEAKVHVSIVNWCKKNPIIRHLDNKVVSQINSSLRSSTDVLDAKKLKSNLNIGFVGMQPNGRGFYITNDEAENWIKDDYRNRDILKLSVGATDLTEKPNGEPSRWIIDFSDMPIEDITNYNKPFEHIRIYVKPERDLNREEVLRQKWWRFKRTNESLRKSLLKLSLFFIVPRHSKWFIFLSAPSDWLPADSTTIVASDDFYILGILTSNIHRIWVKVQSSTLKGDTRYTHNTCFETFPFPQIPTSGIIEQIRTAALELHQYRSDQMIKKQWGITELYNKFFNEPASQLYKFHAKLDALVMQAYGFKAKDDILEKLLTLNLELSQKEKQGEPIVGPWAPD
jgi:type II restriction/modification system DNA methylase subunit YeeA